MHFNVNQQLPTDTRAMLINVFITHMYSQIAYAISWCVLKLHNSMI